MAVGASPTYANTPYTNGVKFTDADGTDSKVVAYGNSSILVLRGIVLTNKSSTDYAFRVHLRRGSIDYQIGYVLVPATSGNAYGVPGLNLIDPAILPWVDSEPATKLVLMASDQIMLDPVDALGSGDEVHVTVFGGRAV